ncbi:MAG: acyl-CoA dehydrogenase family protein [Steroidobacteraceae bacterium]
MNFAYSNRTEQLRSRLRSFMDAHIVPRQRDFVAQVAQGRYPISFMAELKARARAEGLWNLFLPGLHASEPGTRLSNLEYAPLAEIMGAVQWAPEVFNCSAPDTGNMELLHMFGTPDQKATWLTPLLEGEIRSCFAMTEPDVASSDASNVTTAIRRDGDHYVIDGRKWFITGAANPGCKVAIVMGKTDFGAAQHQQQSMCIVPLDTPGVRVVRDLSVMNHHSYETHAEVVFESVRVPDANLLGSEGEGFVMAQARLGPGRIHHCMRCIGQSELALQLMTDRVQTRVAFGRPLSEYDSIQQAIARSRCDIEQARLLVLRAAWTIDNFGVKAARDDIALIKVVVPEVQLRVVDRAIQAFGAMGLSPDTPLPDLWTTARILRIADGPDEVHLRSIARREFKLNQSRVGDSHRYYLTPDRRSESDLRKGSEQ